MVKKTQSQYDVEFPELCRGYLQYIDVMMFNIVQAVDVLGQSKPGIVFMPIIERYYARTALAGGKAEIAVGGSNISQGQAMQL